MHGQLVRHDDRDQYGRLEPNQSDRYLIIIILHVSVQLHIKERLMTMMMMTINMTTMMRIIIMIMMMMMMMMRYDNVDSENDDEKG